MADHTHSEAHHGGGPSFYLLIAAILGVITFVEFAIIQWPQAWLSTPAVLIILIVLSIAKFLMVIAYFMHLRDDENTYSGFFASGMVIALGTFVVLTFLFTVPSVANTLRGTVEPTGGAHGAEVDHGAEPAAEDGHAVDIPEEVLASILSDGYSRQRAEILDSPRPKDQSLLLTPPPLGAEPGYTLSPAPPFGDAAPGGAEPADTTDPQNDPAAVSAQAGPEYDPEQGLAIYNRNCVGCHQSNGRGIPGAFPPLAEHTPTLYNAEGGRSYLIAVVLYGLQGQIEVAGARYSGVMPAWAQISDEDIATLLNYVVTEWDNRALLDEFVPFTAAEVAAERGRDLSATGVYELRQGLDLP